MKKTFCRAAGAISTILLLCAAVLFFIHQKQTTSDECFSASIHAEKAGYHTLLIDYSQPESQDHTLSIYINGVFSRKASFAMDAEGSVHVPVYLKEGRNRISLRIAQGDQKTDILAIDAVARSAPTKMVLAPHEDDEVLGFAASIMQMLQNGDDVLVVFVTNGDWKGKEMGMERLVESAKALSILGLPPENMIVMGYPDAELPQLLKAGSSRKTLDLQLGEAHTYGNPAYRITDFHTLQHGKAAAMSGYNIRKDLYDILSVHMPCEIYLASQYDLHQDHASTYTLTIQTLKKISEKTPYSPLLHETVIHGYDDALWPERLIHDDAGQPVINAFTNPFPHGDVPLDWEAAVHVQLTPDMIARKHEAIMMYHTQNVIMGWIDQNEAYLKSDEFYWTTKFVQ